MRLATIIISALLLSSCSKKINRFNISDFNNMPTLDVDPDYERGCSIAENYIPDEYTERQDIRVNFHLINCPEGDCNFSLEEGKEYLKGMYWNACERLTQNKKMNLPVGNDTPVLNLEYTYKIVGQTPYDDGFYAHKDSLHYFFMVRGRHKNNYKKEVINKYAIADDSILNIFIIEHHPDSLKSKTYADHNGGIALGTSIKMTGLYNSHTNDNLAPWHFGAIMNHEIGHVFGLAHAWTKYDGCDDTPVHPNCFSSYAKPGCDSIYSNNLMDYSNQRGALTPCQIGRIHRTMNNIKSKQRKLLVEKWCQPSAEDPIIITTAKEWHGHRDIRRPIVIKDGGSLDLHCRLSMAEGMTITVEQGGVLKLYPGAHLHNSCGHEWGGIVVHTTEKDVSGQLIIYGSPTIEDVKPLSLTADTPKV